MQIKLFLCNGSICGNHTVRHVEALKGATTKIPCNLKPDYLGSLTFTNNTSKIYIKADTCMRSSTDGYSYINLERKNGKILFNKYVNTAKYLNEIFGNVTLVSNDKCDLLYTNIGSIEEMNTHCPYSEFVFFGHIQESKPCSIADPIQFIVKNAKAPRNLLINLSEQFTSGNKELNTTPGNYIYCNFEKEGGVFPSLHNAQNISYMWFLNSSVQKETSHKIKLSKNMSGKYKCNVNFNAFDKGQSWSVESIPTKVTVVFGPEELSMPEFQIVEEGSKLDINCRTSSNPEADFSRSSSLYDKAYNSIKWAHVVNRTHNGTVKQCRATNPMSSLSRTAICLIIVNYGPDSMNFADIYYFNESDFATIACSVASNPEANFSKSTHGYMWYKPKNSIVWSHPNISRSQNGSQIRCHAESTFNSNSVSKMSTLVVYYGPYVFMNKTISVHEGNFASIDCEVISYPPATTDSSTSGYIKIKNSIIWKISTVTKEMDQKEFQCIAYNSKTRVYGRASTKLTVYFSPDVAFGKTVYFLEEEENCEIECVVRKSNPNITHLSLIIMGQVVKKIENDMQIKWSADRSLNGRDVTCVAENEFYRKEVKSQIIVHYGPEISMQNFIEIHEGEDMEIECNVESFPPAKFQNSTDGFIQYFTNRITWKVEQISRTYDQSIYRCSALNEKTQKTRKASTIVNVFYAPEITMNVSEVNLVEDDYISVECKVLSSNPPTSTLILKINNDHFLESSLTDSLTFQLQVNRSHGGKIECIGRNSFYENSVASNLSVYYVDFNIAEMKSTVNQVFKITEIKSFPALCNITLLRNGSILWTKSLSKNFEFDVTSSNVYYEYILEISNEFTSKQFTLEGIELHKGENASSLKRIAIGGSFFIIAGIIVIFLAIGVLRRFYAILANNNGENDSKTDLVDNPYNTSDYISKIATQNCDHIYTIPTKANVIVENELYNNHFNGDNSTSKQAFDDHIYTDVGKQVSLQEYQSADNHVYAEFDAPTNRSKCELPQDDIYSEIPKEKELNCPF